MQRCSNCGADLPANSRFCGKCGSVQDTTATEDATTRSNTPQPYWSPEGGTVPASQPPYAYPAPDMYATPGNQSPWSPDSGASFTPPPPPPPAEQEDERRGIGMPPWSAQYGAGLGAEAMMGVDRHMDTARLLCREHHKLAVCRVCKGRQDHFLISQGGSLRKEQAPRVQICTINRRGSRQRITRHNTRGLPISIHMLNLKTISRMGSTCATRRARPKQQAQPASRRF
jgi:hypothetical protein